MSTTEREREREASKRNLQVIAIAGRERVFRPIANAEARVFHGVEAALLDFSTKDNGNERQATRGRRGKATYLGDRILAAVHEACASAEQRGQVSERIGRAETKRSKGGGEREREREKAYMSSQKHEKPGGELWQCPEHCAIASSTELAAQTTKTRAVAQRFIFFSSLLLRWSGERSKRPVKNRELVSSLLQIEAHGRAERAREKTRRLSAIAFTNSAY